MSIKIPFPKYISFKHWATIVITSYGNESLPIPKDETKWREFGAVLASTGVFRLAGVPPPFTINKGVKKNNFNDWRTWAESVYKIMAVEKAPN
jgi:hypothetical protein